MEKKCSTCGRVLPDDCFYKNGHLKTGKQRFACECKDCRKEREKARYYDHAESVAEYRKPCVHCGEDKPYLIEFHHRVPEEKEFIIAHWRKKSKKALVDEIKKCDPLCKNCHAEFHYLHDKYGTSYEDYLKGSSVPIS